MECRRCMGFMVKEVFKVFETQIHGRKFEMYNDTVLGFNKSGKEIVRIQVEEPIYIRPAERVTWL